MWLEQRAVQWLFETYGLAFVKLARMERPNHAIQTATTLYKQRTNFYWQIT